MKPESEQLVRRFRTEVADQLAQRLRADEVAGRARLNQTDQRLFGRQLINQRLARYAQELLEQGRPPLDAMAEAEISQAVHDALFGFGPLQRLLEDDSIENIDANGCDEVWITRSDGTKERAPAIASSDDELIDLLRTAAARVGLTERRFDTGAPSLNLQLPDGSRLFAIMAVTQRPSLAIRRHRYPKVFLSDLQGLGTIDLALREFLAAAVRARKNIIVCGGVDAGKTTLLRALLNEIGPEERLVTIEDNFEIGLDRYPELHPDVVALEGRERNVEGEGEVSLVELVRWGLRMNPDRVIVGEVRGAEVLPMLNAMSQGNDGSMCTLHSNSSAGAFGKLAMYAIQAPERLPLEATNLLVANAVDLVVHLGRDSRSRFVASVREVVGADGSLIMSNEVFVPGPGRRGVPGAPLRSATMDQLVEAGFDPAVLTRADGWWGA
ncbi:MAG: Flp pilus assembly complex ATPase component TadA [Actinobacteria bacterium]|nr:Flp pilus assembly complex ATPase component TadA [Actinomycetota bacterium]MBW3650770.1 Flp pilus assembly complex ATPase component TadA [Actinomycetota bacterium]